MLIDCPEICHVTYTCEDQLAAEGGRPWPLHSQCLPVFGGDPNCYCQEGYVKDDSTDVFSVRRAIIEQLGSNWASMMCVKPLEGHCVFCEYNNIPYQVSCILGCYFFFLLFLCFLPILFTCLVTQQTGWL